VKPKTLPTEPTYDAASGYYGPFPITAAADIYPFYLDSYQWANVKERFMTFPFDETIAFYLRLETGFVTDEVQDEVPAWKPGERKLVGKGLQVCPRCSNFQTYGLRQHGVVTGIRILSRRPCECVMMRLFWSRWSNPKNIGLDSQNIQLDRLIEFRHNFHRFKSIGELDKLIRTVTQYPRNSYLLAGPHGVGKSTLLTALYGKALMDWSTEAFHRGVPQEAVFIVNATVLQAELHAWSMKDTTNPDSEGGTPCPLPTITHRKILAAITAGFRPAIFIEELDKIKHDSEFQRREFSLIFETCHAAGGQIVCTSNLNEARLRQRFGDQFGGGIIRRVTGARGNPGVPEVGKDGVEVVPDPTKGGFYIDFWDSTIVQNFQFSASESTPEKSYPPKNFGNHAQDTRTVPWPDAHKPPRAEKTANRVTPETVMARQKFPIPQQEVQPKPKRMAGPDPAQFTTRKSPS